jgi:hypothetical protein
LRSPFAAFIGVTQLPQRIAGAVAGVLGAIGLLLCAVGLYAVVAVAVGQRRRELAIRMAMGAAPVRFRGWCSVPVCAPRASASSWVCWHPRRSRPR